MAQGTVNDLEYGIKICACPNIVKSLLLPFCIYQVIILIKENMQKVQCYLWSFNGQVPGQ